MKGQADYVTQVDFAVQSYLKERLLALHPQAGFLAEEQENVDYSGRLLGFSTPSTARQI